LQGHVVADYRTGHGMSAGIENAYSI